MLHFMADLVPLANALTSDITIHLPCYSTDLSRRELTMQYIIISAELYDNKAQKHIWIKRWLNIFQRNITNFSASETFIFNPY